MAPATSKALCVKQSTALSRKSSAVEKSTVYPLPGNFAKKTKALFSFYSDVREIIQSTRVDIARSVDCQRVIMYWRLGERIFVEEQRGKKRAKYGEYLIKNLADAIEPEYGSGFSYRQLAFCRQFYLTYPIVNALRSQFNWMQYRLFIQIKDPQKREYYEHETLNNHWTGRELERQINALLYERLLASNDKEAVLAVARRERIPEKAGEVFKEPAVLELVGLKPQAAYYEKDLEQAIITHMQEFLLELGNGFSFVARQKRIVLEDDEFFVDLVFYNRLLRCFVLIELKTHKATTSDMGQLQMYVNYFDRVEKLPEENPTVGILLCTEKNSAMVRFSLPEDNKQIFAAKYQLYLPSEKTILSKIQDAVLYVEEERAKYMA